MADGRFALQMEIYLGSDPTSTICARSTVFSTDYTTCADLYLLKDTWDNLKQCGWNTTEDDQFLTFINTIHVRVYDNIKNPVGGFYVSNMALRILGKARENVRSRRPTVGCGG